MQSIFLDCGECKGRISQPWFLQSPTYLPKVFSELKKMKGPPSHAWWSAPEDNDRTRSFYREPTQEHPELSEAQRENNHLPLKGPPYWPMGHRPRDLTVRETAQRRPQVAKGNSCRVASQHLRFFFCPFLKMEVSINFLLDCKCFKVLMDNL